jgi:hypothetical protein
MKLLCRDASKIPKESLFCIDKKLYKIAITMETKGSAVEIKSDRKDEMSKENDDRNDSDNFDDVDDLEEEDTQVEGKMSLDKGDKENQQPGQSSVGGQKGSQEAGSEDQLSAWKVHD